MALKLNKIMFVLLILFCTKPLIALGLKDTTYFIDENGTATSTYETQTDTEMSTQNMQGVYENSPVEGKKIDEDAIKKLSEKYNYTEKPKRLDTQTFKQNTTHFELKSKPKTGFWLSKGGRNVAYVLAVLALIVLLVVLFYRAGKSSYNKKIEKATVFSTEIINADNLSNLKVDDLLSDALDAADFRLAIRLLYLNSLKLLMEKGFIRPSPEKTNYDYVRELNNNIYQSDFKNTTRIFEIVWYGNSNINNSSFQNIKNKFADFQDKIRLQK
jgi:hypothetical protein